MLPIIAGAAGGGALLIIVAVALFFYCRHQKGKAQARTRPEPGDEIPLSDTNGAEPAAVPAPNLGRSYSQLTPEQAAHEELERAGP